MPRARPLLLALLLSLLIHAIWFSHGLWSLPATSPAPAPLKALTAKLRKLSLDDAPAQAQPAPSVAGTVRLVTTKTLRAPATPPAPVPLRPEASAPVHASAPRPAPVAASRVAEASAPSSLQRATEAIAALEASVPTPAVPVPAPSAPGQWLRPAQALTRFPDQATLHYHAYYGAVQLGSGVIHWQRQGGQYRIEARIKGLFSPLLRYESEGSVRRQQLRPDRYQAWRDSNAREYARFDHEAQLLYYGDKEEKTAPLQAAAQDVLSLGFALALGGGELGETATQITTGKKVYRYPLKAAGESEYDTGEGKMRIVLVRASADGDVNEYWLAPDFANLPVRIVRADDKKTLELRAHRIDIDGSTVWALPPRKMKQNEN